jgi:transposase-like protein
VRAFIEQLLEEELEAALGRERYERGAISNGRRHGHRPRQLVTTFGPLTLSVPRARLHDEARLSRRLSRGRQRRMGSIRLRS